MPAWLSIRITCLSFLLAAPLVHAAPRLSLQAFLEEVKQSHAGYLAAGAGLQGAALGRSQADLLQAPRLGLTLRHGYDSRPQLIQFAPAATTSSGLDASLSQDLPWGPSVRLGYALERVDIDIPALGSSAFLFQQYYEAKPSVSLSLPLAGGAWGSLLAAKQGAILAASSAKQAEARFARQAILMQASLVYWRTSAAFQETRIKAALLQSARLRVTATQARHRARLADSADVTQAQAQSALREIELGESSLRLQVLLRELATYRQIPEPPAIQLDELEVQSVQLPARSTLAPLRADTEALGHRARETDQLLRKQHEELRAQVALFGDLTLWGRAADVGQAFTRGWGLGRKTATIGVQVQFPLDFSAQSSSLKGTRLERDQAGLAFDRAVIDQDQEHKGLVQRQAELTHRLQLLDQLLELKQGALALTEEKQKRGRATTFELLELEDQTGQARLQQVSVLLELCEVRLRIILSQRPEAE